MIPRAIYRVATLANSEPPYDRASLKVFYPAEYGDSEEERNSGLVPPVSTGSPFPVVLLMPGINVGPEAYTWLARELALSGVVTVTYTLVAEEMPGYISLTPGLSITELSPGNYGQRPSGTAIAPILDELSRLNANGILAGRLDLNSIILAGHSAGGTVALLNARPDWFPGLVGTLTYGSHAAAATALGYPEDAMFDVPDTLPLLIMAGTRDGCIANSSARYGDSEASPTDRVERTFDEALSSTRKDSYLAIIDGANHFSLAHPADESTGRPFIDMSTTQPDEQLRELLSSLTRLFVASVARRDESARQQLENILLDGHPLITRGDRR